MTLKKSLVLSATALFATAGLANADVNTYVASGIGGAWNDPASWTKTAGPDADTYPDADDVAIIDNPSYPITVNASTSVANLQVTDGGMLQVNAAITVGQGFVENATIVLDSATFQLSTGAFEIRAGGNFFMDGTSPIIDINVEDGLKLKAETSSLYVVTDASITGPGSLKGEHAAARVIVNVETDDDVELTLASDVTVHGQLVFTSAPDGGFGRVKNLGLIKADVNGGKIILDQDLAGITDSGDCANTHWMGESNGTLRFERTASTLGGSFNFASGSAFEISTGKTVATTGLKLGTGTYPASPTPFSHGTSCP